MPSRIPRVSWNSWPEEMALLGTCVSLSSASAFTTAQEQDPKDRAETCLRSTVPSKLAQTRDHRQPGALASSWYKDGEEYIPGDTPRSEARE